MLIERLTKTATVFSLVCMQKLSSLTRELTCMQYFPYNSFKKLVALTNLNSFENYFIFFEV